MLSAQIIGPLQSIACPPGARIVNHHPFGRSLRRFCRDMLPLVVERHGYGFQDGGCLMLAHAIAAWSDGTVALAAIYRTGMPNQAQHVVARFGEVYLDSDGLGTEEDLIAKVNRFEGDRGHYMGGYDQSSERVIPFHMDLSLALTGRLRRRFGTFESRLLAAH